MELEDVDFYDVYVFDDQLNKYFLDTKVFTRSEAVKYAQKFKNVYVLHNDIIVYKYIAPNNSSIIFIWLIVLILFILSIILFILSIIL